MTKEEIHQFLADTKVYVNGKSKEIQEKLFSLGYKWANGDTDVCYTDDPFLFIYKDKSLTRSNEMNCFSQHENREITAEQILSLELTEPTYRPFKDVEECWQEMLKHEPFGWLKRGTYFQNIMAVDCAYIYIETFATDFNYKEALGEFTFADGTPFGIKEE